MSTSNILFFSVILVRIRNILYIHIPLHRTTQHPLERVLCRYNCTPYCINSIAFHPIHFIPSHPIIVRLSSYFPSNRSHHNTILSKIRSIFFIASHHFFPIPVDYYSVAISIVFSNDRTPVIRDIEKPQTQTPCAFLVTHY